jgi:hypothetical protein
MFVFFLRIRYDLTCEILNKSVCKLIHELNKTRLLYKMDLKNGLAPLHP